MNEQDCIFCKIIKGEAPSKIVYEDDNTLAFLDIFPVSRGHTVVVPKKHYRNIEELPEDEITKLFIAVKNVAILIHKKLEIDGYNIVQNNFTAAGQAIEHSHVHIVPRKEGDNKLKLDLPKTKTSDSKLKEVQEKLIS